MKTSSIFKIYQSATPEITALLNQTVLGTNGAKYKHLDTNERIQRIDHPLFLTLERNNKVLGNITFCRRQEDWYIRYFAFSSMVQSAGKQKNDNGNSFLKKELAQYFDDLFIGSEAFPPIRSLYAYIDPHNARSKWMSENFGFSTVGKLATQTFSRVYPKKSKGFVSELSQAKIKELTEKHFSDYTYFTNSIQIDDTFCGIQNENNELLAFARYEIVHWEIQQLPGKRGKLLTKLIPFIPFLNRIIKPKKHTFLVPDLVWCKDENTMLLTELFESMLAKENLHLILWWIDEQDPLYVKLKSQISWGMLHKLVGVSPVDVVQRLNPESENLKPNTFFVRGIDMV